MMIDKPMILSRKRIGQASGPLEEMVAVNPSLTLFLARAGCSVPCATITRIACLYSVVNRHSYGYAAERSLRVRPRASLLKG